MLSTALLSSFTKPRTSPLFDALRQAHINFEELSVLNLESSLDSVSDSQSEDEMMSMPSSHHDPLVHLNPQEKLSHEHDCFHPVPLGKLLILKAPHSISEAMHPSSLK